MWYTGIMPEQYKRLPNTACIVCNQSIYRRPVQIRRSLGNVFCSMVCYGKSCRKESPCRVCKKPILASLNKRTCSRACANVQRTGIRYDGRQLRNNVVSQQATKRRLIAARGRRCERCGYSKTEILNVHHKDRNRKNNDLSNLELICPNCHSEEHYLKK